ncbi:MAG: polymer-forming cytoskeletal protein [Candidatus Hydrogenedens sp.]|nr:polymer-forming cytoskeletal protein [Candidatus Hydrogenedentota bacterium]NLF56640.1 polymer-forming cytoskeletal protein [Candidatus Hydrogenedens sp.]
MSNAGDAPGIPEVKKSPNSRPKGLLGGVAAWFDAAIHRGRGGGHGGSALAEIRREAPAPVQDAAQRRARNSAQGRMVIPGGVLVAGSLGGGVDAEIAGRVEGDIHVKGVLVAHKSAVVTGGVSAVSCQVDGVVEGPVTAVEDVSVGRSGRVNAEVRAGKNVDVSGCVAGNISSEARLRLLAGCVVNGDVCARVLVMEDGATLNGLCSMAAKAPPGASGLDAERS